MTHMTQCLVELDNANSFNFLNRTNRQRYETVVEKDTALAKLKAQSDAVEVAPVTFEPPPTPRIDMHEQRIF